MSFQILVLIMLVAGLIGGAINFLLPANADAETRKFLKPWWQCAVLGIGATLLVPLFLEVAQSKLLDDVYFDFQWERKPAFQSLASKPDIVTITREVDPSGKLIKADTTKKKVQKEETGTPAPKQAGAGKSYLLYFSYALIAASAGFRFINMLVNNIVKDEQINKVKAENKVLSEENTKRAKTGQKNQEQEDMRVRAELAVQSTLIAQAKGINAEGPVLKWPVLGPVKHPNDPQKGRFQGEAVRNNRRLAAEVKATDDPDWFRLMIWVESVDAAKYPLAGDVVFYLHDSFHPSVYVIEPHEFLNDKAGVMLNRGGLEAYGAFTVGAITDRGETMLELDLSKNSKYPKVFRER